MRNLEGEPRGGEVGNGYGAVSPRPETVDCCWRACYAMGVGAIAIVAVLIAECNNLSDS
jgi:hypothetical protein